MDQRDKGRFAQALVAMGEMYDKDVSQALAAMYFGDLAAYSADQVLDAMAAHRLDPARGRFFPKVADLIDKLRPSVGDAALLAWSEVLPLLRNSRSARSDDPITERTVRALGGWLALGQKTAAELVWVEKEFVTRYTLYATHGLDPAAKLPQLANDRGGLRLIESDA